MSDSTSATPSEAKKKKPSTTTSKSGRSCPVCNYELEREAPLEFGSESVYCRRHNCGVHLIEEENKELTVRTFQLNHHQTVCVFPFAFGTFEENAQNAFAELRRSPRWDQIKYDSEVADDIDRTEYFLPYARRFLFPSLYDNASSSEKKKEPSCQHFRFDMSLLGGTPNNGTPFTLRCQDDRKKRLYHYDMSLAEIRLSVFNYHVGFLQLTIENTDSRANYFDQMNSAIYMRLLAPLYPGFQMPQMDLPDASLQVTQLLPYLLAEFSHQKTLPRSPEEFPPDLPKHKSLPVKPIYDDRMMVYTFSCIDSKTTLHDREANENLLRRHSVINFNNDMQEEYKPDAQTDLAKWTQLRWWGFSKEGGSLTAFDINRFHANFLGTYYNTYYFDIFLLAAMQRVTLLLFFERLSDIPSLTTGSDNSQKILRRLRKDLLLFKNQSWFSQLTNRERGLELWRNWQNVFENRALLQEVNEQSQELDTYLQSLARERLDWVVRLGGFLATAVPAILGLPVLFGKAPWVITTRWILLLLLLLGTSIFAWRIFRNDGEE